MALDINRIRALCYDIDGTLQDTDDQLVAKITPWLTSVGFLINEQEPKVLARRIVMRLDSPANTLLSLLDRFGLDHQIAMLDRWLFKRSLKKSPLAYRLVPGSERSLAALMPSYPLAVVSARGDHQVKAFLKQTGLAQYFTCVVGGHTRRFTKPHPMPIHWAASRMGVASEACLMIGDTVVDIEAGKAAGAQTVGVLSGFGDSSELEAAGADLILASVAELPSILSGGDENFGQ
jgi:phosphoglycolate phosphatase-like HAD superfamily hydrolase